MMKIKVLGVEDELILKAMAVINQTFFTENEHISLIFHFEETIAAKMLRITGMLNGHISERTCAQNDDKARKSAYLAVYFLLLQQATHQKPPWGLLNGMRPMKLIHELRKCQIPDDEIKVHMQNEYLVADEKIDLLLKVAKHQLRVLPDLDQLKQEVSLYIGIPFCPTKCAYCTFATYAYEPFKKWVAPFLEVLLKEIKLVGAYLREKQIPVTSIYFGGGTATMLETSQLEELFIAVFEAISFREQVREITVEAGRPDTITPEKIHLFKKFHIDRISINPQSFNQKTLDLIGRHHQASETLEKFALAKKGGIKNINMDLIVGLPGEGPPELATSLKQIKKLQPESLTVHMLAFKRNSEITRDRGLYPTVSKADLHEMSQMTYEFTKSWGYSPYYLYRQKNMAGNMENIGYAKQGHESIYNILMMEEAQNILGLGVGAASKYLIGESIHNPRDLKTYIETYEAYALKKLQWLAKSL